MRTVYARVLPALILLWLFCPCVRADSPSLTGFYYEDDLDHPLAGALIALYKADNNLLVDFTYSRNDGAFTLKAPATNGKYYVVATRDQFSHKVDFDYDPQTPAQNLLIPHHQPKSWISKVIDYVGGKLVEIANLLLGLFIGLGFKVYEDRRKARQVINREIKSVKDSAAEILGKYQSLQDTASAYGASTDGTTAAEKRAEYIALASDINGEVEELRKQIDENADLEEAIYTAHTLVGRDNYGALRKALREIKELTTEIVTARAKMLDLPAPDRDKQLEPFRNLGKNNLLKDA
jgi:hypothetical protein